MKWIVDASERRELLGDLYGIFFEDLNHAADGGLYGELIRNRSFEFDSIDHPEYHHLTGWEKIEKGDQVKLHIMTGGAVCEKNPHYLSMDIKTRESETEVGIQNLGYNSGIPVTAGSSYFFTCYGKREQSLDEPVMISIRSRNGEIYASQEVCFGTAWEKYELVLHSTSTDYSSRLAITVKGRGKVYLDFVSLFPEDTFLKRRNGMRRDIADMLQVMNPGFMRFPGGCLVHDGALDEQARDSQYRWKNTIGPLEARPARRNNWNYNQTLGLGYFEYFQFCEDIGTEPLPVLPGGYDPHHQRYAPLNEMEPFINDALDLIEFANGSTDTVWGAKRAECGHPEPFHLNYIGIGNEEVMDAFFERYDLIHKAIREKYPDIKIINTGSPFAEGGEYDRGWANAKKNRSDLVDEHYYMSPEWFLANHHRYDSFKEEDPKVFLGEYASWGNTWYNALVEASYMTGLERNAKSVALACYAPMLANVDYVNWRPDMIWFDNHRIYGSANYYVQKLFMNNKGVYRLESHLEDAPETVTIGSDSIYGEIMLSCNKSTIYYSDIEYADLQTGEKKHFDDVVCDHNNERIPLLKSGSCHYQLEVTAREVDGWRGMQIIFGHRDDKNEFNWILGGWQNLDTLINEKISGKGSDLCQHTFSVQKGRTYRLKLEVKGRHIRTYVDGMPYHDTKSRIPVIEPLYTAASINQTGDEIVLKAVNVSEQARQVTIVLSGLQECLSVVEIQQMAGYDTNAENSFDEPEKVIPAAWEEEIHLPEFAYNLPAQSVTFFIVRPVQRDGK